MYLIDKKLNRKFDLQKLFLTISNIARLIFLDSQ